MKFQPEQFEGTNVIARHEGHRLWVGTAVHEQAVLVPWRGEVQAWPAQDLAALSAAHFEQVAALEPEVVIFGSGARLRFVSPALLRPLIDRRIGVETMDTAAACRTYNVLVSEGRSVVAALLPSIAADA